MRRLALGILAAFGLSFACAAAPAPLPEVLATGDCAQPCQIISPTSVNISGLMNRHFTGLAGGNTQIDVTLSRDAAGTVQAHFLWNGKDQGQRPVTFLQVQGVSYLLIRTIRDTPYLFEIGADAQHLNGYCSQAAGRRLIYEVDLAATA